MINSIKLRNGKSRILIVALLGVALIAGMILANPGAAYADGWEKIFKFKSGKDTYVGALSYKGTYEKEKKVRGILGVKSADSKITIPSKVKGLEVKVVQLYNSNFSYDGVKMKTKTSNLKSINLKNVTELIYLSLTDSKVTKLDLSKNKKLKNISLYNNKQLKSLDLSKNTQLKSISLSDSKLKSLNLSKNTKLTFISITGAKNLKSIDFSHNKKLKEIYLDKGMKVTGLSDSKYKKINWE
jgi:hypothetical protein